MTADQFTHAQSLANAAHAAASSNEAAYDAYRAAFDAAMAQEPQGKRAVEIDASTRAIVCDKGTTEVHYRDDGVCDGCAVNETVVIG